MVDRLFAFWRDNKGMPLEAFLALAPVYAHSIDGQGRLINVSTLWAQELQYDLEEMIGRRSTDFLTPESEEAARTIYLPKFFAEGALRGVRYNFQRKDGTIIPVLMDAGSISHEGRFERSLAVFSKSTETGAIKAQLGLLLADLEAAGDEQMRAIAMAGIRKILTNI